MEFGRIPVSAAAGAILAHSLSHGSLRLKKGRRLSPADVGALVAAGIAEVTVARPGAGDVPEDAAAAAVAAALVPDPVAAGLRLSAPFTGRVNLFAEGAGLLRVDRTAVDRLNAVDPALTLATLPDHARVAPRQMVATVKVIPYAAPAPAVAAAVAAAAGAIRLLPFRPMAVSLILTRIEGMKPALLAKGAEVVAARVAALGLDLLPPVTVPHVAEAVAAAIRAAPGGMVLILGASATSDPADTCPQGLVTAGGALIRFGMPVDPGNLLFLGRQAGRPVVGLPGCARSPALNGADFVLERLAAGIAVDSAGIAAMGVGGLLKEIPQRPQPRAGLAPAQVVPGRPRVSALVLAAGASRRMRGADKLLEPVAGLPLLRRVAEAALASQADEVVVVLPPAAEARRAVIEGLGVTPVVAAEAATGMANSIRAGLAALDPAAEAVVLLLADMPEIGAAEIDRVIAGFDPEEGREIVRAVAEDGTPGHPVLFGRRFFESLAALSGDAGARAVLRAAPDFVSEVPTRGRAAITDLDTPEAWAAWRVDGGG